MNINKEAYTRLVDEIKTKIDERLEKIFENDKDQLIHINRLCQIASTLGVNRDYFKDILNFITPSDVENEIMRIKQENNLRFKISRDKNNDCKAFWTLSNSHDSMTIELTKEGIIFCDGAGCSTTVALPKDMEWFVKEWAKGRLGLQ